MRDAPRCWARSGEKRAQIIVPELNPSNRPHVPLTIGHLDVHLFNKYPMCLETVEGVTKVIEMLKHMRPTVEA